MKKNIFKKHIFWFIGFIALQILFINKILSILNTCIIIPIYIIPIIWLPINTNKYFVLIYAFVLGFILDIFCYTVGLYSTIVTVIGFLRIYLLQFVTSKNKSSKSNISLYTLGTSLYFLYITTIYLVYFILLTFLEYFHFHSLWYSMGVIFLNVLINVGIALGMDLMKRKE